MRIQFMVTRISVIALVAMSAACGPAVAPRRQVQNDPAAEASYGRAVSELGILNRQARDAFEKGKQDDAAALIARGEPLSRQLMGIPRPTPAATEAAAERDRLYADMLFSNRNYGWARLLYQRNVSRWRYAAPRTPETELRLKQAEASIAECDRRIEMAGKAEKAEKGR
jgi:hypothetical protein